MVLGGVFPIFYLKGQIFTKGKIVVVCDSQADAEVDDQDFLGDQDSLGDLGSPINIYHVILF